MPVLPPPPSGPAAEACDDLERLLGVLPGTVRDALAAGHAREQLLEVVLDLGRVPEARYPGRAAPLGTAVVARGDLAAVVEQLGDFGGDNRAGIERTLHRISAIRNRRGEIVGLTCRVGRAVFGTVGLVRDLLDSGRSLLLMGPPGVGKTTALREIARVLADELEKRVVVIDTSNEIAGDGDIPHPAIGRARRMQVARPELQHQVMIEAVENHMPEVIVIDEIGTELEAQAARTIAERGVMLVATAHGNELANLIKNPTLADLVGGIQSVTLGDEEARRRRSQKTVLERAAEPTFPVAVEIHSRGRWLVHADVAQTVDQLLRGQAVRPQVRELDGEGRLRVAEPPPVPPPPARPLPPSSAGRGAAPPRSPRLPARVPAAEPAPGLQPEPEAQSHHPSEASPLRVYGAGIARAGLEQVVRARQFPVQVVGSVELADVVLAARQQLGRDPHVRRLAQELGLPILVIKSPAPPQLQRALERLLERHQRLPAGAPPPAPVFTDPDDDLAALEECRLAVEQVVLAQGQPVELLPRSARVRQLQAELADHYRLRTAVFGHADQQRLRVFPA